MAPSLPCWELGSGHTTMNISCQWKSVEPDVEKQQQQLSYFTEPDISEHKEFQSWAYLLK